MKQIPQGASIGEGNIESALQPVWGFPLQYCMQVNCDSHLHPVDRSVSATDLLIFWPFRLSELPIEDSVQLFSRHIENRVVGR